MNLYVIMIIACILIGFVWDFWAEFYYDSRRELHKIIAWTLFAIAFLIAMFYNWDWTINGLGFTILAFVYEALCLFTMYNFYQNYLRKNE